MCKCALINNSILVLQPQERKTPPEFCFPFSNRWCEVTRAHCVKIPAQHLASPCLGCLLVQLHHQEAQGGTQPLVHTHQLHQHNTMNY